MFSRFDAYNFITTLIPGAALTLALRAAAFPVPELSDVIPFIVVSFALGAISNRLGSLIVDPIVRKLGWLPERDYGAYIRASDQDKKIDAIVQNASMYRTFGTAGLLYFLLIGVRGLATHAGLTDFWFMNLLFAVGIAIFTAAYIGQDRYIGDRVAAHKRNASARKE